MWILSCRGKITSLPPPLVSPCSSLALNVFSLDLCLISLLHLVTWSSFYSQGDATGGHAEGMLFGLGGKKRILHPWVDSCASLIGSASVGVGEGQKQACFWWEGTDRVSVHSTACPLLRSSSSWRGMKKPWSPSLGGRSTSLPRGSGGPRGSRSVEEVGYHDRVLPLSRVQSQSLCLPGYQPAVIPGSVFCRRLRVWQA